MLNAVFRTHVSFCWANSSVSMRLSLSAPSATKLVRLAVRLFVLRLELFPTTSYDIVMVLGSCNDACGCTRLHYSRHKLMPNLLLSASTSHYTSWLLRSF
jgi:hypothetical protein